MIDAECLLHPDSAFARKMEIISQNAKAERMDVSIKGILARHLDVVIYSGIRQMFRMERQVDMGAWLNVRSKESGNSFFERFENLFYQYSAALHFMLSPHFGNEVNYPYLR